MSTPPTLLRSMALLYLFILYFECARQITDKVSKQFSIDSRDCFSFRLIPSILCFHYQRFDNILLVTYILMLVINK